MRAPLIVAAAALVLAAFAPAFVPADSAVVTVHADCTDGRLGDHHLSPDPVNDAQDESIDWELDDASTATNLEIAPKQAGHWPFANDEHFKGGRGRSLHAHGEGTHMHKQAAGEYAYDITFNCPDGHGGTNAVHLDPTIIVH